MPPALFAPVFLDEAFLAGVFFADLAADFLADLVRVDFFDEAPFFAGLGFFAPAAFFLAAAFLGGEDLFTVAFFGAVFFADAFLGAAFFAVVRVF